jgi:hypothetical protein
VLLAASPVVADDALLSGNMIGNPSFEYDWHNNGAEGHVLAFMGDWSFNASDLQPDYWNPAGAHEWVTGNAHTGNKSLLLKAGGSVSRGVIKAGVNAPPGGGDWRWGNPAPIAMTFADPARLARPVTASVWYRSDNLAEGSELTIAVQAFGVSKAVSTSEKTDGWKQLTVTLTREEIEKAHADGTAKGVQMDQQVSVGVKGNAAVFVDDISLAEDHTGDINLAFNGSFEQVERDGYPSMWDAPSKYRFYTQQYYKWTSWHHFFEGIRGPVSTTDLVARSGRRSLQMQVFPGDEMKVDGRLVELNQTAPGIVEIGAYVKLDRVKWIDIRAVDENGNEIPSVDPFGGGWPVVRDTSQIYPSNADGWTYVRKAFLTATPLKAIRPQLCARGFNGDVRDDGGTRATLLQVGLAWWDDVRVTEISATPAELAQRGLKAVDQKIPAADALLVDALDLGDRAFGDNTATVTLRNPTNNAVDAKLSLTIDGKAAGTATAKVAPNGASTITLMYVIGQEQMRGDWREQGTLDLKVEAAGKTREQTYHYNTWPVLVDVDFYRHHPLPTENPQKVAINLGVSAQTLAKTQSLVLELRHRTDGKVLDTVTLPDVRKAMADTIANFAALSANDFGTPNPVQFANRANLVAVNLDLGKLPVHPYDNPVRDAYLRVRGVDAQGKELFADDSQFIGRVAPNTEQLPAIEQTLVREDGAVMVNGKPVFMMAGNMYTTGHYSLNLAQNKAMGHNAIRWVESVDGAAGNWNANLYSLETMVSKGKIDDASLDKMAGDLATWKAEGKLSGVVTIAAYYEHSSVYGASSISPEQVEQEKRYTRIANTSGNRISNWGGGGAHNLYTIEASFDAWDSFGLEIEPFGPPRGAYELAPILRKGGKAWFHLPQTYNSTPYEAFRIDQYVTILMGGRGFSTIHGLGDPSFMRGITGEIRYLSPAIFSLDHGPAGTQMSHHLWWMQRKHDNKTTIIALSKPAAQIGEWTYHKDADAPDGVAHTGISSFEPWRTPDGIRLHGFREAKPVVIEAGDRFVQWVKVDPKQKPKALAWGVRGDAKWDFNAHYGTPFDFQKWRDEMISFWLGGELLPGTWQIGWQYNDATKNWFANHILTPETFKSKGAVPEAGKWVKMEMLADDIGIVGKQADGFFFLSQDGQASWGRSSIVRGDQEIVLSGATLGASAEELKTVRIAVPWAPDGTKVKVLFEERELVVKDGHIVDDFTNFDIDGPIRHAAIGDAVGWHARGTQLKAQTIGYVTPHMPSQVRVYEIVTDK